PGPLQGAAWRKTFQASSERTCLAKICRHQCSRRRSNHGRIAAQFHYIDTGEYGVISAIKRFFESQLAAHSNDTTQNHEHRLRLASAALLFEVLKSDRHVDERE